MKCKYCNIEVDNKKKLTGHQTFCKSNENRIIRKKWTIERKQQHSKIMQEKSPYKSRKPQYWSEESRAKMRKRSKEFNSKFWTKEKRLLHSIKMKEVVANNPDSYSKNNVSGRVKTYEYKGTKLKGRWELEVAKWLDKHGIKWTNEMKPFEYEWNNKMHLYFPDFYLIDYDKYIEVKGFERERDRCKWKVVNNLVVIKKKEIQLIKDNKFKIARIQG